MCSRFGLWPLLPAVSLAASLWTLPAQAQRSPIYIPVPMPPSYEATDSLTEADIPTGDGGFARDYVVSLEAGEQVVIDLASDQFDTIITLMTRSGTTIGQNDDGPDGTTNSQLFTRIPETGEYILRVTAFGGGGLGEFNLKATRLRPVGESCP
ncbi:MAG: PPC domain-containing protein [Kaiparowitsia implicata GSE-PSE-MK54-09C]|nr:PPC domain-containing protein [Kaiparowitsia implicata GSE-PSE-MK54-09C]